MYSTQLIIPANTSIETPIENQIEIAPSIVRSVRVLHPTGCVSLVGVWFEYRSTRLWPTKDDSYFLGNGSSITFNPETELSEPPLILSVLGYNLDDTYIHRPLIEVDVDFIIGNVDSQATRFTNYIGKVFNLGSGE